ncbi:metallophosphoesterase family protein [Anaerovorax odorimutans]|uniref:Metallophosphoesterase family protein n=1 Tax=Anaerovorax odorimutans TaxID=109327 RepID=A0ABT1RK08_9FIRM|nr:metallophosphoesterase [Anaerovorax odorimutans]MCQ4635515.1 metallophosphoesterase family protein [Anaerovorax odorimutans]
MSYLSRLDRAFSDVPRLPLSDETRYVLVSDCHRGNGTSNDNFLKNQNLYHAALEYYFRKGYTYIELGDGDELWENRRLQQIIQIHSQTFEMLFKFYQQGRLYFLYGNHDKANEHPAPIGFPAIARHSGLILQDQSGSGDLYLTHGHQADFLNSSLWRLSRLLVRYLWKPLEHFGVLDPTSAAKNNQRKNKTEKKLSHWAEERNRILVSGHTHRPRLGSKESPYFNTGSCVHPYGVTAIEITGRCLTLAKWSMRTREDMVLYVAREELAGPVCTDKF